jgi:hypothetical protein
MDYQEAIENYNWLEVEFEKLKDENEALKSKLASGIRVTAYINHLSGWSGWMENAPAFDDKDHTNATLILDETDEVK